MARRGDKVHLIATGNQAPYGIGETIAIFPMGHRRRIQAELDRWYSKPDVEIHRGGMLLVRVRGQEHYPFRRNLEIQPATSRHIKLQSSKPRKA